MRITKLLKAILPWLACAAIFAWLLHRVEPREIFAALKLADKPRLFGYGFLYFLIVLVADALSLKHFISRFATPITFGELVVVRGATYVLMVVNYAASQGAFAVYLKKTHGAGLSKTAGTVFFINIADILLVFTSALLALTMSPVKFGGLDLRPYAFTVVPLLYAGLVSWALFWRNIDRPIIARWRRFRIVAWLLEHDVFFVFREATFKDYAVLFLSRAPLLFVVIGSYNLAIMAFQAHVDWFWIYLYNPVVMFLTALPLTPAGLGTGQALSIAFFKNVVTSPLFVIGSTNPENLLFTSSLIWNLTNQIFKATFGAFCLTKTSKNLFKE